MREVLQQQSQYLEKLTKLTEEQKEIERESLRITRDQSKEIASIVAERKNYKKLGESIAEGFNNSLTRPFDKITNFFTKRGFLESVGILKDDPQSFLGRAVKGSVERSESKKQYIQDRMAVDPQYLNLVGEKKAKDVFAKQFEEQQKLQRLMQTEQSKVSGLRDRGFSESQIKRTDAFKNLENLAIAMAKVDSRFRGDAADFGGGKSPSEPPSRTTFGGGVETGAATEEQNEAMRLYKEGNELQVERNDKLDRMIEIFTDGVEQGKEQKEGGGAVTGFLGKIFGGLASGLTAMGPAIAAIGVGMGAALKSLALGFAALANPVTLVGMAAFTVMALGLAKALEIAAPGIEAVGNAAKSVGEGIGAMAPAIEKAGIAIADIVDSVFGGIAKTVDSIVGGIKDAYNFFTGKKDEMENEAADVEVQEGTSGEGFFSKLKFWEEKEPTDEFAPRNPDDPRSVRAAEYRRKVAEANKNKGGGELTADQAAKMSNQELIDAGYMDFDDQDDRNDLMEELRMKEAAKGSSPASAVAAARKSRSLGIAENKLRLYEQGGPRYAHLVDAQRIKVEEMREAEAAKQGGAGNVTIAPVSSTTQSTKNVVHEPTARNDDPSLFSYISSAFF